MSAAAHQTFVALQTLIGRAEAAAVRCNGRLLTEIGRNLSAMFDAALLQDLTPEELQDVRCMLAHYRQLCATLSNTLRAALLQGCRPPHARYVGRGIAQPQERVRAYIQSYG